MHVYEIKYYLPTVLPSNCSRTNSSSWDPQDISIGGWRDSWLVDNESEFSNLELAATVSILVLSASGREGSGSAWDVSSTRVLSASAYTATQCHFPPGLQLGTLLVRYLLHQSRNMHWNKMKSRYWHAIFFKLTGNANPMIPTKTAITLHALLSWTDRLHTNKTVDNLRSCHNDRRYTRDCTRLIVLVIGKPSWLNDSMIYVLLLVIHEGGSKSHIF